MSNSPVNLHREGPPSTELEPPDASAAAELADALSAPGESRRDAIAAVVARWPRYSEAWARLGDHGRDPVERYAAYRVGYHRGLDALRAAGWRGSGYVRWAHDPNRGFLDSLEGLARTAAEIHESDEAERCTQFLAQLDPDHYPAGSAPR